MVKKFRWRLFYSCLVFYKIPKNAFIRQPVIITGTFIFTVLSEEYDRVLIFKEPVSNKALKGNVIRSEMAPDDGSCRVKCYLEPNCVSINLGPQDKGNHVCELNSATEESASMEER